MLVISYKSIAAVTVTGLVLQPKAMVDSRSAPPRPEKFTSTYHEFCVAALLTVQDDKILRPIRQVQEEEDPGCADKAEEIRQKAQTASPPPLHQDMFRQPKEEPFCPICGTRMKFVSLYLPDQGYITSEDGT